MGLVNIIKYNHQIDGFAIDGDSWLFNIIHQWIKGTSTRKPHDLNGKIDGFRFRCSPHIGIGIFGNIPKNKSVKSQPLQWDCQELLDIVDSGIW